MRLGQKELVVMNLCDVQITRPRGTSQLRALPDLLTTLQKHSSALAWIIWVKRR